MKRFKFALEIKDHDSYQLASSIWPHIKELGKENVMFNFLAFDVDGQFALYSPGAVGEAFDHIENGPVIRTKWLIEK